MFSLDSEFGVLVLVFVLGRRLGDVFCFQILPPKLYLYMLEIFPTQFLIIIALNRAYRLILMGQHQYSLHTGCSLALGMCADILVDFYL